jgi:hypothetical protein
MQQTFEDPEIPDPKPKTATITVVMAAVVALAILVSLWFLFEPLQLRKPDSAHDMSNSKMSSAEQDYARQIEIGNITMSRAENFLHQEVTTLEGEIHNAGGQPISSLAVTAEFSDDMHQIVLRETRRIFANPTNPLKAGERRPFDISFEHIPISWNRQTPTMRVSQLRLSSTK